MQLSPSNRKWIVHKFVYGRYLSWAMFALRVDCGTTFSW